MAANPIATFYEAQASATADIVRAALNGAQRIQQLTLQAMRPESSALPTTEQGVRFQREIVQTFAEMNNEIVRASYSMMERMRDALGVSSLSSLTPASFAPSGDADFNPMTIYDTAMRQWQTAVQQMMETPSVAMAVAGALDREGERKSARTGSRASPMASSGHTRKRKSTTRKR
jgi:hypothetical protein